MDHEISGLISALLLSGIVLFAWHCYRAAFCGNPSESGTTVYQEKKSGVQKTDDRKDFTYYKNCGFLKIIVYPIYKTLESINERIKNPGIALILITLLIRLPLTPLTIKLIKSSKNMAGLKDEMENIKSNHKNNPLETQKAVGELFKEKGINPLGSIVLTLIQIPLFFALYKIVREASLFSGASLGLWIDDLGVADPYYVLPALSGLFMFLGTKRAGDTGTHIPGWFSCLLPIMFTVFLLNQPSGLALYILVGCAFQAGINVVAYR